MSDEDFSKGIQYLVQKGIIKVSVMQTSPQTMQQIPSWVKNLAGMWTSGKVSDDDFAKGIEYLLRVGIIHVNVSTIPTTPSPVIPTTPSPVIPTTPSPVIPTTPSPVMSSTNPVGSSSNSTTLSNNQKYSQSLLGSGINLKIINNTASGILNINGKQYSAPDLTMTMQGGEIKLTGNIQGSYNLLLMAVGIHTSGIEYQFSGSTINNDKSEQFQFTALLTNEGTSLPSVISKQSITTTTAPKQTPGLSMLMLTTQNDRVYMAYVYNLVVKIFDPQSNPQKIFDQFTGGISDVSINATIIDPNNKIIGQSLGKTDSKGIYQGGINMPYTQYEQEQLQVMVNATKNGYATQFVTLPLLLIHPNSGSSHFCSITTSSLPDGKFTGGAVTYSQTLSSNYCSSPTWAITSGSLPPGLSLDPSGLIHGTPTVAGPYSFVVTVTTSGGGTATASLSIKIT
ncbi:MAG: Ig domain-containing protein [Nitrosotalea sp.]